MDSVDNSLRLAQQYQESSSASSSASGSEDETLNAVNKYSSYFRLYDYQIVEMQHEYELLLEDKVIKGVKQLSEDSK